MSSLKELPNNKATILDNVACAYCALPKNQHNALTKEHVVGRNFVPRGSFKKGWSLILRACRACNTKKSDLENDISAITLLPDLGDRHTDPQLALLAERKASRAFSRRTKKPVAESTEEMPIMHQLMPGADIRVGLVAPPQIDASRVRELARFHLQGFFYLITYNPTTRMGGFIPGSILFLPGARRSDWGNSLLRSFADMTRGWSNRVIGTGAEGFFRIAIRREPAGSTVWSFALEWNKSFRTAGFFGDEDRAQEFGDQLRWPEMHRLNLTKRYRREIPLAPEDDVLFL